MKKKIIFIAIFLILGPGILLLQSKNNPAIAQQDGEAGVAPNSGFDSGRPGDSIQTADPPPVEQPAAQTPPPPVESPAEHTLNLPNHTRDADVQEPVLEEFIAGQQEEPEATQEPLPQAERPRALIRERAAAPAEVQKQAKEFVQIQKTVQERLPSIPVLPAAVPTQVLLNAPTPAPAPALNSPPSNDGRPAQFDIPQAFPQAIEQPSSDEQRTAETPAFEQSSADDEVTAEEPDNEPFPVVVEEPEPRSNSAAATTANNNSSQGPLICCRLTSDETGDHIFRTKTKGDCVDELGTVFGTGSCRASSDIP
ncbi:MAG: hypothetical protein A3I68_00720 [Candidatus Melainabacteria bacterium RIFCSPLOWO2_02_FULL_35_15]|nr:MAG: hypothetical protein A3F80_05610 [Candidatus Melainabacteria bacterium RIFCSPLOWO2_12_FULL_35_11]OGI13434.1 MAG: hypothetical protein A3I68_00720 [Candidatus Melainabacteria bacterium RIFCSPLOWO2_02_FULL_35_15]